MEEERQDKNDLFDIPHEKYSPSNKNVFFSIIHLFDPNFGYSNYLKWHFLHPDRYLDIVIQVADQGGGLAFAKHTHLSPS